MKIRLQPSHHPARKKHIALQPSHHPARKKHIALQPSHQLVKPISSEDQMRKTKVRVIGIGGGGGSIVSEIASKVEPASWQAGKLSFVVANTDSQALRATNKKAIHFQFGQNFTQGLGTGTNPELGEMAAKNEKEKIKKLLEGQDFCIIVACLGGGTSSGAAPIFAKISKNLGSITYGIFTLPFRFEGEKKMEIARASLEKIKSELNAIAIIPNERIFQMIDKTTPLKSALSQINQSLAQSLEGLIETIYQPGLINIDFADLRTILERKGRLTYLNTIEVEEERGVKEAIQKVLTCPLYPYSIQGAKGVLFNISGGKTLALSEVGQISESIYRSVNKEAKIVFGLSQGQKYQDKIKITLLATGCGARIFAGKPKKETTHRPARKKHPSLPRQPFSKERSLKKKSELSQPEAAPPSKGIKKPKSKTKPKKVEVKVSENYHPPISPSSPEETGEGRREGESPTNQEKVKDSASTSTQLEAKVRKNTFQIEKDYYPSTTLLPTTTRSEKETPTTLLPQKRIRKNALQIKREIEEEEKELLEKEKVWETPAFLRRKLNKS